MADKINYRTLRAAIGRIALPGTTVKWSECKEWIIIRHGSRSPLRLTVREYEVLLELGEFDADFHSILEDKIGKAE